MQLQSLKIKPLYILPDDPLSTEVLIPSFKASNRVDCMAGFFSSDALASLAPGLATYINSTTNPLRLIISPLLRNEDHDAIVAGLRSPEDITTQLLEKLIITENLLQKHTLECFSYLLRKQRIEIKIALMKDALFHPKVWLFQQHNDVIAVHGSSNWTNAGVSKNIEQIATSKSWYDSSQQYITERLLHQFRRLWEGKDVSCHIVSLPSAIQQRILKTYNSPTPPTENEFHALVSITQDLQEYPPVPKMFTIPQDFQNTSGQFRHQKLAVAAWRSAGYRGILEMATGSGKTITALIGAHELYKKHKPLLIIITVPHKPLVSQWCDVIKTFGLDPIILVNTRDSKLADLQRLKRNLRAGVSEIEVVVVINNTLTKPYFLNAISKFRCTTLLIADEVHNLGRQSFTSNLPEFFDYRLGLSATPIRQYDDVGTKALFSFFGKIVFKFTLREAIGTCLVNYDYYVHLIGLQDDELENWYQVTNKIKQNAWRNNDGNPDEYLQALYIKRRVLLEAASNKLAKLKSLLESNELRYTLIYTTDKGPGQLRAVNKLLNDAGVVFHQITELETSDQHKLKQIIESFQNGDIQVLTSKRVLDEGVDIPQVCQAFILASNTVERQWIQRRGRLLRRCPAIKKTHSIIHDFMVLPPEMNNLDDDTRALIRSELYRIIKFASLAQNTGHSDGALTTIQNVNRMLAN